MRAPISRRAAAAAACTILAAAVGAVACRADGIPERPRARASSAFWERWGDGRAELAGYELTTERYGRLRRGELVLIFVTEPMDARTWIKDDAGAVPEAHRANVLKLNRMLRFRTGIYPYSVMTSVFSPVDGGYPERFSPVRITLTAQEWCGHVYHRLLPGPRGFESEIRSYFSSEGERAESVQAPPGTLFEDALTIQLRELDGPFHGGRDWKGRLVPSLWSTRKSHRPPRPVEATIRRSVAERDGTAVHRFVVEHGSNRKTIDVERSAPHRILGWSASDGESARLTGSARLPYWELNDEGDESYLERIGLAPAD